MTLGLQCGWPCGKSIEIAPALRQLPPQKWVTLSLPLRCLEEGMDFAKVNTPLHPGHQWTGTHRHGDRTLGTGFSAGGLGEVVRLDCQGRLSR